MITLSEDAVGGLIPHYWEKIQHEYGPDHIVAISSGGDFLGEKFHLISSLQLTKILIQRPDRRGFYKKISKINKK